MPPTSTLRSAASSPISGIGNSRISVLLGPVLTAANTFSIRLVPRASRLAPVPRARASRLVLLYRRLRDARLCLQRFTRAFLERRARGQHDRNRAHLLVPGVAAGRQRSLRGELLRGL